MNGKRPPSRKVPIDAIVKEIVQEPGKTAYVVTDYIPVPGEDECTFTLKRPTWHGRWPNPRDEVVLYDIRSRTVRRRSGKTGRGWYANRAKLKRPYPKQKVKRKESN